MTWITCLECEAHVSWCDSPEEHTHHVYLTDEDQD